MRLSLENMMMLISLKLVFFIKNKQSLCLQRETPCFSMFNIVHILTIVSPSSISASKKGKEFLILSANETTHRNSVTD